MRRFFRNNGLSVVLVFLFLSTFLGQILTGWKTHNDAQREHAQPTVSLTKYFATGHFWEATAENWESEFLQMGMYVVLTVFLFQKGSSESKDSEGGEGVEADPVHWKDDPDAPWPVRQGPVIRWLYSHSLSIAFFTLFLISFWLHLAGGVKEYNEDQTEHGGATLTAMQFLGTSEFWFQSFQNWQSEFLSLAAMVLLTVWLRERGSPESKPVATPHTMGPDEWETEQEENGKLPTPEQQQQKRRDRADKDHPGEGPGAPDSDASRPDEKWRQGTKHKV